MTNSFPPEPQTFCEAHWRGKSRRLALALYEGFIHFWEPDSLEFQGVPKEWVWAVKGSIRAGQNAIANPRFLEVAFVSALRHRELGQLISLSKFHNVFLGVGGSGEICASSPQREGTSFHYDSEEDVFARPASHWRAQLEIWEDEDTDFRFARQWHDLSENRRARRLMLLSRGDWEEMERVALLVLRLECVGHPNEKGEQGPSRLSIFKRGEEFSWNLRPEFDDSHSAHRVVRRELRDAWFRWFNPYLDYELMHSHPAANKEALKNLHIPFDYRCAESSSHEQLETRLLLRDWLAHRAGLAPERIADLLR